MKRDPHAPVDEIFNAALDLDGPQRSAFIERACGKDARLRDEVQSLIRAYQCANRFLDVPLIRPTEPKPVASDESAFAGRRVGPYELLSLIAAGGMGAVYKARRVDGSYHRFVAIKFIRQTMMDEGMYRRFQGERQTLAGLDHPFIARLLDGGSAEDGLPYFVMELVTGLPITEYCDIHRLGIPGRLRLFCMVCEAVHYAHKSLVVHRDLKPGNVLVTEDETPKLLDFGIARLISSEGGFVPGDQTQSARRMLTPRYASPEQIRGEPITTAADVYSLGVILYELLTGRCPYNLDDKSPYELERMICEQDPPAPSLAVQFGRKTRSVRAARDVDADEIAERRSCPARRLHRNLCGDLDTLVLTAMHKDPNRRYSSAKQLQEDVERYLAGRPIVARKDSLRYRTIKCMGRNKAATVAFAALVLAVAAGLVATSTGLLRARAAKLLAEQERTAALQATSEAHAVTEFMQQLLAAANPYRRGREATVADLLEDAENRISSELSGQPAVEAGVRYAIAHTYAGMWQWPKAVPHLRIALSQYRRLRGPEDPKVADCLSLLGRALTFARLPEAVAIQEEALAIRTRRFGMDHPAVAESTGNLGFALWHALAPPRWAEAESSYRKALDIYRGARIQDGADLARFTFSLAVMLTVQERFAEAEPLFVDALAMYQRIPGGQDRYRIECMRNYASLLRQTDRAWEAERVLLQAMALAPPDIDRPGVRSLKWNLAVLKDRTGRHAEAMQLFRMTLAEALAHMQAGKDHDVDKLKRLAAALQNDSADPSAMAEAAEALLANPRLDDLAGVGARKDLAHALHAGGHHAQAVRLLASFEDDALYGFADPRRPVVTARGLLGQSLEELGEWDRAERLLVMSRDTLRAARGPDDDQTRASQRRLDEFYERTGRPRTAP